MGKNFIGPTTSGQIIKERSGRNTNVLYIFPYPLVITEPINIFKNKGLWPYFQCFPKLVICTITDKQLLYHDHERVKSLTKFSFEVLPLVILFFGE